MTRTCQAVVHVFLYIILGQFLFGCSAIGTKPSADNPCVPNYTEEGSMFSGTVYKCSKEYSGTTKNAMFDTILISMSTSGYQIINSNKELGLISAELPVGMGASPVPMNVVIKKISNSNVRVDTTINLAPMLAATSSEIVNYFCSVYKCLDAQSVETQSISAISPNNVIPISSSSMVVTSNKANIRKSPSKNAEIKNTLQKGTKVNVIKQKDAWFMVKIPSGEIGWCHKSILRQE
jgi:hypothetical protein